MKISLSLAKKILIFPCILDMNRCLEESDKNNGMKRDLELGVGLAQGSNLFDGVAADRIGEVLLGVLEPRVEGRGLLGEGQVELLDLAELILHAHQTLLARLGRVQQRNPARHHVAVTRQDRRRLIVAGANQLILQARDVLISTNTKRNRADGSVKME